MDLVLFLPFLALFGVIIYMQTRQRKRMQAKQSELQASLSIGAPVMLTCGLHGDVADMDETTIDVEIAPGVIATFARAAVLEVRGTESTFVDDTDGADLDDVEFYTGDAVENQDTASARPTKPLPHDDPSA